MGLTSGMTSTALVMLSSLAAALRRPFFGCCAAVSQSCAGRPSSDQRGGAPQHDAAAAQLLGVLGAVHQRFSKGGERVPPGGAPVPIEVGEEHLRHQVVDEILEAERGAGPLRDREGGRPRRRIVQVERDHDRLVRTRGERAGEGA